MPALITSESAQEEKTEAAQTSGDGKISKFLDAVASLPDQKRNAGAGRAAAAVAELYKVSLSAVYQAKKVIKSGRQELIEAMRKGEIPVKTAYKRLLKEAG